MLIIWPLHAKSCNAHHEEGGDMRRRRRNLAWPEVDDCWWRSWWCREDQGVVGGG